MTSIPTWTAILVGAGTPLLTLTGVLVAQLITRKGAGELELRSRREETLRVLRWAAELAVSDDPGRARLGQAELEALGSSEMLNAAEQSFVDAALVAMVDRSADAIDESGEAWPSGDDTPVPSKADEDGERA